jgi:hypothetical protein
MYLKTDNLYPNKYKVDFKIIVEVTHLVNSNHQRVVI